MSKPNKPNKKNKSNTESTEAKPVVIRPKSILTPKQAWHNANAKITLVGKKHINSPRGSQTFDIVIAVNDNKATLTAIINNALETVCALSLFPADLLEGLEFRFLSKFPESDETPKDKYPEPPDEN